MAPVNWWDTVGNWASAAWRAITAVSGATASTMGAEWKFTASLFKGAIFQLTHPINTVEQNAAIFAGLVTGNITAVHNAIDRLEGWSQARIVKPVQSWTRRQIAKLWFVIVADRKMLWARITYVTGVTRAWVMRLIRHERVARRRADTREHAYALARAKWAVQTVDREAASGYRTGYSGQVSTAVKVLQDIITRDPLLKDVVGKVITGVLDLASVEDPLARLIAGFVLQHVITHLGVDKPLGDLARSLLGPILGQPHPKTLHDVIMAMSSRIGTVEQQWATFMNDGGPQVEQAGQGWRDLTSPALDAALLAFAVAGVADPAGTARELSAVIRPAGTATIATVSNILAGG